MKTWVRKTLSVGVLAAGALLFAPGAANADVRQSTGDNSGILNGTQIAVPVRVPVNIVGNAVGILGGANATGIGVNRTTEHGWADRQSTGHNSGILNGTQAYLPINVPVNVVGNSVAVIGGANATGVGANQVRSRKESASTETGWWPGSGGQFTGDNSGILNGTQIYAPIDVPINVCGNSIALLGWANSNAICANNLVAHRGPKFRKKESTRTEGAWQSTGHNSGIANGTQLLAPISLPVNLAGNSVAVIGKADAKGVAVNQESGHDDFVQSTGHNSGILNGTQIGVPINIPINVCGNSLGILGAANSAAICANGNRPILADHNFDDCNKPCWGGHGGPGHGHGFDDCHKPCWGGHGGHGHGGKGQGGHGPGGNGPGLGGHGGDNDGDGDYLGDGGELPDGTADGGFGDEGPAANGNGDEMPSGNGYGDEKPAANQYGDGTRSKKKGAEANPLAGLNETVNGPDGLARLGLLNTLR